MQMTVPGRTMFAFKGAELLLQNLGTGPIVRGTTHAHCTWHTHTRSRKAMSCIHVHSHALTPESPYKRTDNTHAYPQTLTPRNSHTQSTTYTHTVESTHAMHHRSVHHTRAHTRARARTHRHTHACTLGDSRPHPKMGGFWGAAVVVRAAQHAPLGALCHSLCTRWKHEQNSPSFVLP